MTTAGVPVRAGLVAVALLAAAWLATGLRATDLQSQAQAVVDRVQENPPRAEVERAIDRLRDARSFNADKAPVVNEVLLLWEAGRIDRATALGEQVVADEPQNVEGWFALWVTSLVAGDRERAAEAIARVRELDPLRANVLERFDPSAAAG